MENKFQKATTKRKINNTGFKSAEQPNKRKKTSNTSQLEHFINKKPTQNNTPKNNIRKTNNKAKVNVNRQDKSQNTLENNSNAEIDNVQDLKITPQENNSNVEPNTTQDITSKALTPQINQNEKKKKTKAEKRKLKRPQEDAWAGVQYLEPAAQAAYFWEKLALTIAPKLSVEELQDYIPDNSFELLEEDRSSDTLFEFLNKVEPIKNHTVPPGKKCSPYVLLLCTSGERCIHYLSILTKSKFSETDVAYFGRKNLNNISKALIGISTAGKANALYKKSLFEFDNLQYVIIDMAKDAKKWDMFEGGQFRADFYDLYWPKIDKMVREKKVKIVLF